MDAALNSRALISPVTIRRLDVRDAFRSGPFRRRASEIVARQFVRRRIPATAIKHASLCLYASRIKMIA